MATPKSPFYIVRDFLSPKQCEVIVQKLGFYTPDEDADGNPLPMQRHHDESEEIIFNRFKPLIPTIENYYEGFHHRGTELISFEYYTQDTMCKPQCENSNWVKKKWVRTKDRDISCILFLSSYQEKVPFDTDFEVYGGKFEFAQHQFGFNPERGTLICFPSGPHFINAIAPILYGDLFLARFHLAGKLPYLYNPAEFPGDYTTWFKGLD